jgi:hypothetical protein
MGMNTTATIVPQRQNVRMPGFGAEVSVYRARPYYRADRWTSEGHPLVFPALLPSDPGNGGGDGLGFCQGECVDRCSFRTGCDSMSGSARRACQTGCIKSCTEHCRIWGEGQWYNYTPDTCDLNRWLDCKGTDVWEAACGASDAAGPWCVSVANRLRSERQCQLC